MRILFWCGDFYPNIGGARSVTDDLARTLVQHGHQITILSRWQPGFPLSEARNGYQIVRFKFPVLFEKLIIGRKFALGSPAVLVGVAKLLGHFDCVSIGLLDLSAIYLLLLRPFFPFRLALSLHGADTRKLPRTERSYRAILKWTLRAADVVTPVSEELAAEAAAYLPSSSRKMCVIPNGVDTDGIRQASTWQHARNYIVFVGRLVPEKDLETLIAAFSLTMARIPDVDLLICGPGASSSSSASDRIRFLGCVEREKAWSVIKGALFLVLPSRTEGHPIVALEALAAGVPVIGSRIPAIARLVQHGVNGALFSPGDAAELARLIELYSTDRAALRRLIAGARDTDIGEFALDRLVERHLEVYRQDGLSSFHYSATAKAK